MSTLFPTAQTYSGTWNFAPSAADIIVGAFQRIQIRPTEILIPHLQQATLELNLVLTRFNVTQPNLWTVDLQAIPLVQSQASYSIPAETVQITNAYIRTGSGTSTNDRLIYPISQTEYAAISNKSAQGTPTQFWFDRLISPTITFYLTPDGNGPYTCYYYRVRRIQDATIPDGVNVEISSLWMDALISSLAHRLARVFAPSLEQVRKADADEAWHLASGQDVENTPLYVIPGTSGYFKS